MRFSFEVLLNVSLEICLTHLGGGGAHGRDMAPWVEKDIRILAETYRVRPLHFRATLNTPGLAVSLLRARASLNWFAWDNALWAVRLGKVLQVPSVVMVGGFDSANEPGLAYGAAQTSEGRRKLGKILRGADRVFAVSEHTKNEAISTVDRAEVEVLYHGFDSADFPPGPPASQRHVVCTVGDVTKANLRKKGLADVVEMARYLEDVPVVIAGRIDAGTEGFVSSAPSNVRFLNYVSQKTLLELYCSSRVYLQLSRHESFGCAVAEAMLCRCTPVVTQAGALPEVVGATGQYVTVDDYPGIAETVQKAFETGNAADAARGRVISMFSIQNRRKVLLDCFKEICGT